MINLTPLQQLFIAVGGIALVYLGVMWLFRSGKKSQDYSENARLGVNVFVGIMLIAAGATFALIWTGPGQQAVTWLMGLFS